MKYKTFILLVFFIITYSTSIQCLALQNSIPANNTEIVQIALSQEENKLHKNILETFFSFVKKIILIVSNENSNTKIISSDNVTQFSNTIKTYQDIETKQSSDYADSKENDKLEFSTGLLDIIAAILHFFGI